MADDTKKGPARAGSLYWAKSGWRARIRIEVDGETVQKSFDLETTDKAAAKIKLRRLVKLNAAPEPEQSKAAITVAEYAEAWLARREAMGIAAAEYERRFFERVWGPAIGPLPLGAVRKPDIQQVLDNAAAGIVRPEPRREGDTPGPYSRQSVSHLRATIVRLFQAAWKDELVEDNRAARTELPDIEEDSKPRAVLTDAELWQFLACPEVDAEIKVLTLLSRTIGGLRAGDVGKLDWTAFSPGFTTCTFVRRKTRKKRPAPKTLVVPESVRPFLAVWFERLGSPVAGPVFPVRRGPRAGQVKKMANGYAKVLRRELLKAGVDRHELHVATATTMPVDFHSTRRAYATALAQAGANEQVAMSLTGHADSKTHRRYLESMIVEVPAAAVPLLSIDHAQLLRKPGNKNDNLAYLPEILERDTRLELVTSSLGSLRSTN